MRKNDGKRRRKYNRDLKNVHGVKTDAVCGYYFPRCSDENLGIKALRVADIEPVRLKPSALFFSPPAGKK
jgi:hypothetical protein